MNNTIHIACAADNTYVQHTGVMLTSLFENNSNNAIHIHFFSADFTNENKLIIEKIVKSYNQLFSFYLLDKELFKDCFVSHHVSYATYYRVVIPQEINPEITRVLYLDTDIIVCKDLLELWNTDIGNAVLGAIKEPSFTEFDRIQIPPTYSYFNAGILIMNVVEWRKQNLTSTLFSFIKSYQNKLTFWDQDALNANLYNQWKTISPKWNQQSALFEMPREKLIAVYGEKELDEALNNPSIIHYTGSSKPWDYLNLHPYKNEYFNYLKKTIWKNYRFKNVTVTKRIQKLIMRIIGVKRFQKIVSLISLSS